MYKALIITTLLTITFGSCKEINCIDKSFSLAFINFPASDIDTIILRAYQPGTNFENIIDTALVISKNVQIIQKGDTVFASLLGYTTKGLVNLGPRFDWQIYIPSKKRTISISDIKSPESKGSERACWNLIESYKQDGEIKKADFLYTGNQYSSFYYIFIKSN